MLRKVTDQELALELWRNELLVDGEGHAWYEAKNYGDKDSGYLVEVYLTWKDDAFVYVDE